MNLNKIKPGVVKPLPEGTADFPAEVTLKDMIKFLSRVVSGEKEIEDFLILFLALKIQLFPKRRGEVTDFCNVYQVPCPLHVPTLSHFIPVLA